MSKSGEIIPDVMSIKEFVKIYGFSKSSTYREMKEGRLRSVKKRRRRLISRKDAEDWFKR